MSELPVIARRLKEARLKAGLSQKKLGIAAGIDEFSASPRINQYESGKHVPDFATVERLAEVLGVPTPFLYARDDQVAELLLLHSQLSPDKKVDLLEAANELAKSSQRSV
jgi:transcriptional regulator with XRE-family HTH domain